MFGFTIYYLSFALLSTTLLWITYLGYTISIIFVLHSVMFAIEAEMAERGHHLSRAVPKYLEYAYTAVVAGSLLQIFVYAPRMADYVTWIQGDESYLLNTIKEIAHYNLAHECIDRGTKKYVKTGIFMRTDFYYTPEYC